MYDLMNQGSLVSYKKIINKNIIKLINDWNPIEIYPLLEDEYSAEIKKISDFIENNGNISIEELIFFQKRLSRKRLEKNYFSVVKKNVQKQLKQY